MRIISPHGPPTPQVQYAGCKKNNLHSFPPECTMYIYMNPFCKSTTFITGTSDSSVKRDGTFTSLVYLSPNTTVWHQIYLGQNFCPTKYCTVIKRDIFASFPIPISCKFSNAVISKTFINRLFLSIHQSYNLFQHVISPRRASTFPELGSNIECFPFPANICNQIIHRLVST